MKSKWSLRVVTAIVAIGIVVFLALTAPTTWRLLHASRDLPDASPPT